jgi:hypothetical protein
MQGFPNKEGPSIWVVLKMEMVWDQAILILEDLAGEIGQAVTLLTCAYIRDIYRII